MFGALFTRITSNLGKTYLFTGLLPAAIFFAGSQWYYDGSVNIEMYTKSPEKAISLSIAWVGIGLLLFGIRRPVFRYFESMPSGFLNRRLMRMQLTRREGLNKKRAEAVSRCSVARWYENHEGKEGYQ